MKINTKRIFSMIVAICMTATMVSGTVVAKARTAKVDSDVITATATFGKPVVLENFDTVNLGTNKDVPDGKLVDDVYAWTIDTSNPTIDFYFDSTVFGYKNCGAEYDITIEYKDVATSGFKLSYNSIFFGKRKTDFIVTKGSNEWKKMTFLGINDLDVEKGLDDTGADFRIDTNASGASSEQITTLPIRKVTVTCRKNANPVLVGATTNEIGHSFEWYRDEKPVKATFINYSGKDVSVDAEYSMVDFDGVIRFSKNETIHLKKGETLEKVVDVGELKYCSSYRFKVRLICKETNQDTLFDCVPVIILKTDPDGILNEHFGWATHISDAPKLENIYLGIEQAIKSNASFLRNGLKWGYYEQSKGVYKLLEGERVLFDGIRKINKEKNLSLEFLPLLYGGNRLYTGSTDIRNVPNNAYVRQGFTNYARSIAEEIGDIVSKYEIWNEPNLHYFNQQDLKGQDMLDLFLAMKRGVNEADPTALVGGIGATGINAEASTVDTNGGEYIRSMMDADFWKYTDALAYHSYSHANNVQTAEQEGVHNFILEMKDIFNKNGKENTQYWITENGFSSYDKVVKTNENQGSLVTRAILNARKNGTADIYTCYSLEQKNLDMSLRESCYGNSSGGYREEMVEYGTYFVPWPSFIKITGYNYVMAKTTMQENLDVPAKDIYMTKQWSDKFKKNILTVHSAEGPKQITLDLGVDKVTYYDCYGNSKELYGKDGKFDITTDTGLQYFVADLDKVTLLDVKPALDQKTHKIEVAKDDNFSVEFTANTDEKFIAKVADREDIKIVSIPDGPDESGNYTFVFKNLADIDKETDVEIEFYDTSGQLVFNTRFTVNSISKVELEIGAMRDDDTGQWNLVMNVKNTMTSNVLRGHIEFAMPSFAKTLGKIEVGSTPAQCERVVKKVVEIANPDKFLFQYKFVDRDGNITEYEETISFVSATYAVNTPTIDGVLSDGEWNYENAIVIDTSGAVRKIVDWGGKQDVSSKSALMWDEENLYLYAEVTDNIHHQPETDPASTWKGDSIQFGMVYNEGGFVAFGNANVTAHELALALIGEEASAYRHTSQNNMYPAGVFENIDLKIKRDEGKKTTVYEAKIPWTSLLGEGNQPKANEEVKYSYLVNDNDGSGRRGYLEYAGGIGAGKNTTLYTTVKLVPPTK